MERTDRVVVFIDYQNLYSTARSLFHAPEDPPQCGHVWPIAVGTEIVKRRKRPSELAQIRVYRGLPHPDKQPTVHAVNERQTAAWEGDKRVKVFRRPLRYPPDWPAAKPQEKGIDVALAVDLVRLATQGAYDVGVVFSRDTDLMPALEAVREIKTSPVHLEVATWKGAGRLQFPSTNLPWCHFLSEIDYQGMQDSTNYLERSKPR